MKNKNNISRLEEQFNTFHRDNPEVYKALVAFARQWKFFCAGRKCGIGLLFERVRWDQSIRPDGKPFQLCNNHRAFYARLIMKQEADLADLFTVREQRVLSTLDLDTVATTSENEQTLALA